MVHWTITDSMGNRMIQAIKTLEKSEEFCDKDNFDRLLSKVAVMLDIQQNHDHIPMILSYLKKAASPDDMMRWLYKYSHSVEWKIRQAKNDLSILRHGSRIIEKTLWE